MNKKRIFIANDSSFLASGYGVYGKELLTRLHNSGKYEIAELGCYAEINDPRIKNIPWKFYPNAVGANDNRFNDYRGNAFNQFGAWRFNRAILDFKPHIVFDVRDYWMYAYQETSPFRKYFHWVIMPTVDSAPQRLEWIYTFANADVIVPYTDWSKKVLTDECGSKINLFPKIVNAGINPKEFYPIENKTQHKTRYFGKDVSIVGAVMRNQKRKLFADLLLAYKKYLNKLKESNTELYNKSYLYLHTSYPEEQGWDLPSLLAEFELLDRVYFTYICRSCKNWFPSKFQNAITKCKHCGSPAASFSNVAHNLDTSSLNHIYNLFDLFIQYAICEGFGMPQIEAASCGVQIASVDYSAMTEIVEKLDGIKIPLARIFREMETNANRVYPDIDATTQIMYDYIVNTDEHTKRQQSLNIRNRCSDIYSWDNCFKVWDECFEMIDINQKLDWKTTTRNITNHASMSVPQNLNPSQFVEYIVKNIINEPSMVKTAVAQNLIKDLSSMLIARNNMIQSVDYNYALQVLNQLLNDKLHYENMRLSEQSMTREDYLG
jgi:glycosyltransferase involved in cell wall biosynthesis